MSGKRRLTASAAPRLMMTSFAARYRLRPSRMWSRLTSRNTQLEGLSTVFQLALTPSARPAYQVCCMLARPWSTSHVR